MGVAARRRKIEITHSSKPLKSQDVEEFDLLICMDPKNKAAVLGEWLGRRVRRVVVMSSSSRMMMMRSSSSSNSSSSGGCSRSWCDDDTLPICLVGPKQKRPVIGGRGRPL